MLLPQPEFWIIAGPNGSGKSLSSHKRAAAGTLIENAGAELVFLPPYSPDFNPIEKAFAKLKALL